MKKNSGFTLIELVVAMAITMVVAILFVRLSRSLTDGALRFSGSLVAQQQIQQTLQLMMPEIRSASQSNIGGYPISAAATGTFEFFSDVDRNGTFDKVRYFLNGTTFKKGVVYPTGNPLAYVTSTESVIDVVSNIIPSNQIFTYYDVNATSSLSTPLPSPVDVLRIKTVKVSLVVNQGTVSAPSIVGVEDEATIRNLRYK